MRRRAFTSKLGIPCVKPPWGLLTAVDMQRGNIKWQIPLGNAPYVGVNVGMPNIGGPIITAGGYKGDSKRGDHVVAYALPR